MIYHRGSYADVFSQAPISINDGWSVILSAVLPIKWPQATTQPILRKLVGMLLPETVRRCYLMIHYLMSLLNCPIDHHSGTLQSHQHTGAGAFLGPESICVDYVSLMIYLRVLYADIISQASMHTNNLDGWSLILLGALLIQ